MILAIPLAWLQLKREKFRLLVALAGVSFAVVLIFMQLGFQDALFDSSVRYHNTFIYDLAMISPKMDFIVQPEGFSRRRLIQVLGIPGVESMAAVYLGQALWRNPEAPSEMRSIFVVGFDPSDRVFAMDEINESLHLLRLPDTVLYATDPSVTVDLVAGVDYEDTTDLESGSVLDPFYAEDADYSPVLAVASGTGFGANVAKIGFTGFTGGFAGAYTSLDFKVKALGAHQV